MIARNEYIGNLIGGSIGRVVEVDIDQGEMNGGEYMRVRVEIKVGKPLLRGKKMNMGMGNICWVRFAYERLPNFFYCCGKLDHSHRECRSWAENQKRFEEGGFPYGQWMRVEGGGNRR